MSQSGPSSNASPGSSFASPGGPWPSFLRHLTKHGSSGAKRLLAKYQSNLWDVARVPVPNPGTPAGDHFDVPFAQIIEVLSDSTVRMWSSITYRQLHDLDQQSDEVDRFMNDLRSCEARVSSRLLVLGSTNFDLFDAMVTKGATSYEEFCTAENIYAAEEDLLIGHVLGIEYDMGFSSVERKLGQTSIDSGARLSFFKGLGYTYGDLVFHSPDRLSDKGLQPGKQFVRAYSLGQVKIKNCNVDCNVIQFAPSSVSLSTYAESILPDRFLSATKPSDPRGASVAALNKVEYTSIADGEIIAAVLRKGDWARTKVDGNSRLHWLDAIVRLLTMMAMKWLNDVARKISLGNGNASEDGRELRRTADLMQAAVDQVEMFVEEHSDWHRDDCAASLNRLRRLTKVADNFARHVASEEEDARYKKQMEMNELNITESRSAIGLTVIASIFVPVSLASSIFGMNVQQINDSGHDIWAFVVCAIAMWMLTALAWLSWQARRNWKVAKGRADSKYARLGDRWTVRETLRYVDWHYPSYSMGTLPYWLGFRRLEKHGLSKV